jgi:hypothetical protein
MKAILPSEEDPMKQSVPTQLKRSEEEGKRFRDLPLEQRVLRLQKFGILDKDGKLAKHYRRKPATKTA